MTSMKHFLALVLAVIPAVAQNDASPLHRLFDAEWDYQLEQNPVRASTRGDRRWNALWPDRSLAAIEKREKHDAGVLRQIKAIERSSLTPADQLNYDLFRQQVEWRVEEGQYRWYLIPFDQREGIQTESELTQTLRFNTVTDYSDWIARLRTFDQYMDQTIALLREGARVHLVQPKNIVERIAAQVDRQSISDPDQSPFYAPFTKFSSSISEADQKRLAAEARAAISKSVLPSFRKLKQFLTTEYMPAAYGSPGIWQAPQGAKIYAFFARKYTTTNLTPAEIHQIGLGEVKRIRGEMDAVMRKTGFTGTYAEFLQFLRTDPRFYYKTSDELFDAYKVIAKTVDPNLIKVFRLLPRTPYGVFPIPATTAPDTTTASYNEPAADGSRPGGFYVNLYKPETRPKYEMMALTLHESVPGHHVQIALALEQGAVPKFRRGDHYTAFVEGWGLYAESLGEEMGLYTDPYSKFGQLTYEMWRAVRLVVDTGMHSMRWDRQKAIDYFLENAAKSELDVTNEIDRYIAWPGQALAYKIGELKIKELRARATAKLGPKFDLKEFHEVVLSSGALPLNVLEQHIDAWIVAVTARP